MPSDLFYGELAIHVVSLIGGHRWMCMALLSFFLVVVHFVFSSHGVLSLPPPLLLSRLFSIFVICYLLPVFSSFTASSLLHVHVCLLPGYGSFFSSWV